MVIFLMSNLQQVTEPHKMAPSLQRQEADAAGLADAASMRAI